MDMSLYQREFGYYMTEKSRIGPHGDYYTSPHLHPIFGWLLANQLDEIKRIMGDPHEFTVLEIGAGKGYLAEGIIDFAQRKLNWKGNWKYIIVEKNRHAIKKLMKQLKAYTGRIEWKTSLEAVDRFCGCVISNELLDAFPVHLVEMHDQFQEIYVISDNTGFKETKGELSTVDLHNYINRFQIPAIRGYRTEINLNILNYLNRLDDILSEGFVISIDYGYSGREYYAAERNRGSLLCYHKHRVNQNPYQHVGDQDITAHVNFTSLKNWGAMLGMQSLGYCPQGIFLASLGIDEIVSNELANSPNFQIEMLKIKGLLFGIGDSHKAMIQYKGKRDLAGLRGFKLKNSLARL
ncbi:SAM-dependent methyltransferase, MidA [Olavius sp. associated proteobacterium Delta 1]|nr:SAM-dependent methyltransferase, MidA [Olavius sp. associated proteobacterium Delta 1]